MTTVITRSAPPALDSDELRSIIEEIAADAKRRRDGEDGPPFVAIDLIREHRLGAVRLPVEEGGAGYTLRELFTLLIRLAEADPDVPHIIRIHLGFVEERRRTPDRVSGEFWLDKVRDGLLIGGANSELTSRAVGVYTYDTTLTPDGDGYRLDGTKFYSTGSLFSDYLRVSANDSEGKQISAVVPAHREGIEHVNDWDGIGQRHTGSGTTRFDNVRVEKSELLPFQWSEHSVRPRQAFPQLLLHAVGAGILRSVVSDASGLVRGRARSYTFAAAEEPRHDPQLLQIIGSLSAAAYAAEAIVLTASDAQDIASAAFLASGEPDEKLEHDAALAAAKAKISVEGLALNAATELFGVGGASATRQSAHLDRHWRNLRTLFSHNPTVYKARTVGDFVVNDAALPSVGFF